MTNSYKIYLIKSQSAASLIALAFQNAETLAGNKIISVESGPANGGEGGNLIPRIYYGQKYFYVYAEYQNNEGDLPKYELVIC